MSAARWMFASAVLLAAGSRLPADTLDRADGASVAGVVEGVKDGSVIFRAETDPAARPAAWADLRRLELGAAPVERGLIGCWGFDSTDNGVAQDDSPRARSLQVGGLPLAPGRSGNAAVFSGSTSVELPHDLVNTEEGSAAMWFRASRRSVDRMCFFYANLDDGSGFKPDTFGSFSNMHLGLDSRSQYRFYWRWSEKNRIDFTVKSALTDNQWHHAAATWKAGGKVCLYLDGKLVESTDHPGVKAALNSTVSLGGAGARWAYMGLLDDVRFYNCALTAGQVEALFNMPPADQAPAGDPVSDPAQWRVELGGGQRLRGQVTAWADGKMQLAAVGLAEVATPVAIPVAEVQRLIRGDAKRAAQVRQLLATLDQAQDAVVVLQEDKLTSVPGRCIGIAGPDLKFEFQGKERAIKFDRVVGLALAAKTDEPGDGIEQVVRLHNGDMIRGRVTGWQTGQNLTLAALAGEPVRIDLSRCKRIEVRGGRFVELTDLKPSSVRETAFFGRAMHYRVDQGFDGGPLRLADGPCERGLAMHSRCIIEYDLSGRYERFGARLGFEFPGGKMGRAAIRVVGDQKTLLDLSDARGTDQPREVDLAVTGVATLRLEVDFGAEQDVGDRVIWAEPYLLKRVPAMQP